MSQGSGDVPHCSAWNLCGDKNPEFDLVDECER